jgi:hypothetical protein
MTMDLNSGSNSPAKVNHPTLTTELAHSVNFVANSNYWHDKINDRIWQSDCRPWQQEGKCGDKVFEQQAG